MIRGAARQAVFRETADYEAFLEGGGPLSAAGVELYAYCLVVAHDEHHVLVTVQNSGHGFNRIG